MKTFIKLARGLKCNNKFTQDNMSHLLEHEIEYETYIKPLIKSMVNNI